ncbi:MAG TPA: 50S ribosomal protein L15 [Candidatus Acidoferrales bacterium]|nr:50S ribosomal protein L15 [Candidatus Acidoferrales bacterium]
MADEETSKKTAPKKTTARKASAAKAVAVATPAVKTPKAQISRGTGLAAATPGVTLAVLRENKGARPKRVRVGRGHGSGMVKTGGEGGKGQTVRSGGGKGPAFEGGQTPWARRLPHRRGYSQKARDIGHFRTRYAVVNLAALTGWDAAIEITPQSLVERNVIKQELDGVKILGGLKPGKELPRGLKFSDVVFSASAREALSAAGATLPAEAEAGAEA